MLLELRRLEVPPGQWLLLQDVTWQEVETILEELGDHRSARLAYDNGTLEMMMPLLDEMRPKTWVALFQYIALCLEHGQWPHRAPHSVVNTILLLLLL
jgi:Uma2 family endonuclease